MTDVILYGWVGFVLVSLMMLTVKLSMVTRVWMLPPSQMAFAFMLDLHHHFEDLIIAPPVLGSSL